MESETVARKAMTVDIMVGCLLRLGLAVIHVSDSDCDTGIKISSKALMLPNCSQM